MTAAFDQGNQTPSQFDRNGLVGAVFAELAMLSPVLMKGDSDMTAEEKKL